MFGRRRSKTAVEPGPEPVTGAPGTPSSDMPSGEAPSGKALSPVQVVDDASFMELTEGGYTVVDFWAGWCAPCRSFAPVFASVAAAHSGPVRFGACDVDSSPATAELLGIRSIPTLVVFGPDGSEVGRSTGLVSRGDLEATVEQLSRR